MSDDVVKCCPHCGNARIKYRSRKKRHYCGKCATPVEEPDERVREGHTETIASEIGSQLAEADPTTDVREAAKQAIGGGD